GATLYLAGRDCKTGELVHDATSCAMCKRHIINAGIAKVIVRRDENEYEETVKRVCETATILQTDKIRMFSFFNAYTQGERVVELLTKMTETATSFGVKLYHENEKDIYGDTVERVEELLRKVPALGFVYDPANFLQVGEPAEKTLARLSKRADYFHVKDVIVETGELVPAGYGDGRILKMIEGIDGDKVLTLEPHLTVFDGYAQIDGTAMKNKFTFKNGNEAFDFAVSSLKKLLNQAGYREEKGVFQK
ncbi:MAG: TIM barrel protein, partial [Clostridia bacterium]|nr:TIM barrel protein [Clostridia bacterium]